MVRSQRAGIIIIPALAQLKRDMLYSLGKLLDFQVDRVIGGLDRLYEARGKLETLDAFLGRDLPAFGPRHACSAFHDIDPV